MTVRPHERPTHVVTGSACRLAPPPLVPDDQREPLRPEA